MHGLFKWGNVMRRSLSPYYYNLKRRCGEKIPLLIDPLIANSSGWITVGTVNFNTAYAMQLATNGAYSYLYRIIPDGNFSIRFSFAQYGKGGGSDQCFMYFANWDQSTNYLVGYLRQYSSGDQYFAWAIKTNSHYVYNDAAVFYNCTKYNWYSTAGTWYTMELQIINQYWMNFKIVPYNVEFEGAAWDYQGPIYMTNNPIFFNGHIGFYSALTGGNGFCIYDMRVHRLIL